MTDIITASKGRMFAFDYTNHRGEVARRRAECSGSAPIWGSTEWHPEQQWFLPMFDLDQKVWRDFALKDMRNVQMETTP